MMSGSKFIGNRMRRNLTQSGSTLLVYYNVTSGGTVNPGTQEVEGGTSYILSGTMKTFAIEEPARSVVRQFAEVKAGDLICDINADGLITLLPGQPQSGQVALDSITAKAVKFGWQNRIYAQQDVGSRLAVIWDAVFMDQKLHRTLLLRLET